MKKICFFSGDITREGGTERVSVMLANNLKAEGRYEVLFLSLVEQKAQPFFVIDHRIRRYTLGNKWINPGPGYLGIVPKLRKFLKEQQVDVLIDIDVVLDILSLPAARGMNTKILSWEHFNYFYEQKFLYRRLILRYFTKRTDYVVTLTEEDKQAYGQHLKRTEHISAIHNLMESGEKTPQPLQVKKENWIITVGRLIHRKGIDYLAQVAAEVLKVHKDWKWYVLGEGEDRVLLEEVIAKNGLGDQLILTGTVENVDSYLEKAKLFVMTSRVEGLPMCLLEAKNHRLPCISFDIQTGPREIISDQVNGYLVPAFDCKEMVEKIEMLIEDEELREKFAENTQIDTEKFQMEAIMENWNGVLESLCGYKKR